MYDPLFHREVAAPHNLSGPVPSENRTGSYASSKLLDESNSEPSPPSPSRQEVSYGDDKGYVEKF